MVYLKRALGKMSIVVFVLLFLLCSLPLYPTSASDYVGVIGDDYPEKYKNVAKDGMVDEWRFYNRECVSFVSWRLNSQNGIPFYNYYKGKHWGNGSNWKSTASQLGYKVNTTPARGAVYWKSTHVASVSGVSGNTVTIEEYNYDHEGHYRYRNVKKGADGVYYLHIKDLSEDSSLNISGATIKGLKKKYKYSGEFIVPKVRVKLGSSTLAKGSAYTVSCTSNQQIGTASLKIVGNKAAGYSGTISKTFKIVPVGTTFRSLTSKKKNSVTAVWNLQEVQTDGYQIQYATNSSMTGAKKKLIPRNTVATYTVNGITGGQTCYIRIRTYKQKGLKKVYSKWCKKKTVYVK